MTFISVYSKNIHIMPTFHKFGPFLMNYYLRSVRLNTVMAVNFMQETSVSTVPIKICVLFCPNYPACQSLLCGYVIFISSTISLAF